METHCLHAHPRPFAIALLYHDKQSIKVHAEYVNHVYAKQHTQHVHIHWTFIVVLASGTKLNVAKIQGEPKQSAKINAFVCLPTPQ